MATSIHPQRPVKAWLVSSLLAASLVVVCSQMTCAEVQQDWPFDDGGTGDGGNKADGDGAWHCYTGTAMTEEQLLNHCTEAERIDRPTLIPPTTWDGKSPLPGS